MNLTDYLSSGVRQIDLARVLGIAPALVSQWANGVRRVPAERCPAIERATAGVVTCEELRPDVDWAYLRGSTASVVEGGTMQRPSKPRLLPTSGQGATLGCQTDDPESTAVQPAIDAQPPAGARRTAGSECQEVA